MLTGQTAPRLFLAPAPVRVLCINLRSTLNPVRLSSVSYLAIPIQFNHESTRLHANEKPAAKESRDGSPTTSRHASHLTLISPRRFASIRTHSRFPPPG